MKISSLYNAICRGKWFISFGEVESNSVLIGKMIERGMDMEDNRKRSDIEPLSFRFATSASAKSGNSFADAPEGSTAIIPLHGTMLKYGTYCSYGTCELADLMKQAADTPNIMSVLLDIDSGGGSVDAIAPLIDAIKYAKSKGKPVVAHCDLCASAAYYVACHCDEIIASNAISSEFGSIGVMMSFADYTKYYENSGVKQHTVYSNHSDYKNAPFEAAKAGDYTRIREEELDPLALSFQAAVKANRPNLNIDTEGILRGKMFYAEEACKVGLADSIGNRETAIKRCKEHADKMLINDYINSNL